MARVKDLTFRLPRIRTLLEVWSSDTVHFAIANVRIALTLENTVSDILEVVSIRSAETAGLLNPRCLKAYYKHQEIFAFQPLSDFLTADEIQNSGQVVRIRIEINKDLMASCVIRPALLNINLKLASGKTISVREPLSTSVHSLKSQVAESIGIDERHIDHFEFNGGERVENEESTIGELLGLDIAPLGELNFYVALESDFQIKLSSPVENILRCDVVYCMLDTSILTIKYFIIDQYNGNKQPDLGDIKIIYFGRILKDSSKLKDTIYSHTSDVPANNNNNNNIIITLHFVLKEPEELPPSQGFWSDFRNGSLFEFLPREPNPNFQQEVQRDLRLREQLGNGNSRTNGVSTDSVLIHDDISHLNNHSNQESSSSSSSHDYINGPPSSTSLTGDSFDAISTTVSGITRQINQVDLSTIVYKITLNTGSEQREVTLSSSQAIINENDPLNPYLMLSPSGFAKLERLGISIEKPEIRLEEEPAVFDILSFVEHRGLEINIPQEMMTSLSQGTNPAPAPAPAAAAAAATAAAATPTPVPAPQQGGNIPGGGGGINNINFPRGLNAFPQFRFPSISFTQLVTNFLVPIYEFLKYYLLYTLIFESFENQYLKLMGIMLLSISFLTRSTNSHILRYIRERTVGDRLVNSIMIRVRNLTSSASGRFKRGSKRLIELAVPLQRRSPIVDVPIRLIVGALSFIITFIPQLSGAFVELIDERNREIMEFNNSNHGDDDDDEGEGRRLGTQDAHFENVDIRDGATGLERHEN